MPRNRSVLASLAVVAACIAIPTSAGAQQEEAPPAGRPGRPPEDFRIAVGYRGSIVRDPSFDAFSANDYLSQLSLDASYAWLDLGRFAVAAGAAWDFGSRSANVQGLDTRFQLHRLTVPVEARLYALPWLYVFGRAAFGAATYQVQVASAAAPLSGNAWVFATDLSGGASILVVPQGEYGEPSARVWVTPEVGYGWTGEASIGLTSNQPILVADARTDFSPLAFRGFFFRASLSVMF